MPEAEVEKEEAKTDNSGMSFAIKEQQAIRDSNEGKWDSSDDFRYKEDSEYSEKAQREIYELHKENKNRRLKARDLETKLNELTKKIEMSEEQKMKEEGKLQELLQKKESELEQFGKIKEEHEMLTKHFQAHLESTLGKLSPQQAELINESGMSLAKKLEWATRLSNENLSQSDSPDKARPGGKADEPHVDLDEYRGKRGREKLIALSLTNPKLYQRILDLKSQEN